MTDVVAALITDGDRFMICRRPRHKARGLKWEFVGGKTEPGETHSEALMRECKEELDAEISVGELFIDVIHEYPDLTVHLFVYKAALMSDYKMLEHEDIRFILPSECVNYDFCPADKPVIDKIKNEMRG